MKLHRIIELNEQIGTSLLIEELLPYKKSLWLYFLNQFDEEPVMMVTEVFNAAQYGKIVPVSILGEEALRYHQENDCEGEPLEELEGYAQETIANSILLKDL